MTYDEALLAWHAVNGTYDPVGDILYCHHGELVLIWPHHPQGPEHGYWIVDASGKPREVSEAELPNDVVDILDWQRLSRRKSTRKVRSARSKSGVSQSRAINCKRTRDYLF